MRFWRDLPQHEIGDRLGISQMHVSRLLTATLLRLREILESDRHPEASEPRGSRGALPNPDRGPRPPLALDDHVDGR
ncbi:sigma factor-like helix-turn-helix DNA-binding protein [Yinghuangia aomiensis]